MRVAEAFAGVGGFSLGLHQAGFEHVALIEWEPYAQQVLRKRFPGVSLLSDVCEVTGDDLPALDILAGSPPCQSASVAGRRGGRDDERWLWGEFLRLVSECRPAVFVAENVPGLLSLEDGDAFASILEEAGALSYSVEWDILSAAAVGAPHRRERVFIVGRRDGRQTWPQREQPTLFPGRPQSWPKAGRWTDGTLYERERQWPTPSGAMWPTPRTSDTNGPGLHGVGDGVNDLRTAVSNWTTPRAGDSKQGPSSTAKHLASGDLMLTDEVRLNPRREIDATTSTQADPPEVLRALRDALGAQEVRQDLGVPELLQEAAVLLARVLGAWVQEGAPDRGRPDEAGEQVPEGLLRALWEYGEAASSPQGREQAERVARQLGDALRELPHEAPLGDRQVDAEASADRVLGLRPGGEDAQRDVQWALSTLAEVWRPASARSASQGQPEVGSGRLNPDWCETLMNLPVGWTDPSCDEPEPRPYPWPMAVRDDGPLYGASPQAPWEPPRLVEPVKGDGRRHRLRCIGNAVVPACAEVIARSIAASLEREEEHAHAAR